MDVWPSTLKILTISSLYPSSIQPSFGVFVENRLRHLLEDTGITAKVIAPVPWFPFKNQLFGRYSLFARTPKYEVLNGIEVYHPRFLVLPKVGARLTPFFLALTLKRAIRRLRATGYDADLFDAHYLYPDGVAVAKVAQAFKKPFVMTARGSDVTEIGRKPFYRRAIEWALSLCSHAITVSNSLRDELKAYGLGRPITTLRNGVDGDRFCLPTKTTHPTELSKKKVVKVLYAGWLIPRKRVDLLLDAVAKLENVQVEIAGDGPEQVALKAQAEALGIADKVAFLGRQTPEHMPEIYGRNDILVLPSEREGWANVLLEAMACGTPVVSNAVAGALDLVTDSVAGRLVHGQTGNAYAEAIQDLALHLPNRQEVRRFALQFGWREISLGQQRIFQQIIANSSEE